MSDPYRFYEEPAPDDWLDYYDDLSYEEDQARDDDRDPEREADEDWEYSHPTRGNIEP
jgi:hypothetical protein